MEIKLQHPYTSDFKKGYLTTTSEGRKSITLVRNDGFVTSVSYARYIMATHVGYYIPDGFEVDHKDNDRTNDDINNLQLLTPEQNRLKQALRAEEEKEYRGYECAYCGISFLITFSEAKKRMSQGVVYAFCGRSCAAKLHAAIREIENKDAVIAKKISPETIEKIKGLNASGKSAYRIAIELGISDNTVRKYLQS